MKGALRFPRVPFGKLPSALRKKSLQIVCFERVGVAPNERLLESMDRQIVSGGASACLNVGKGILLRNRYSEAVLEIPGVKLKPASGEKRVKPAPAPVLKSEERGIISEASLKRISKGEKAAVFDAEVLAAPASVRPLRAGDRIRPFGLSAEKKAKEILIDRKIPREERWGRPVVCDAEGRILWIPGIVRSAHAPVSLNTRRVVVLRLEFRDITGNNR